MAEPDPLSLLTAVRLVRSQHTVLPGAHLSLALDDQTGVLDPAAMEPLVSLLSGLLPKDVAGIAVGAGTIDVVLGYLLGKQLEVPVASIVNRDGVIQVDGKLPRSGSVWTVISVLDDPGSVSEFVAACAEAGVEAGGVIALVDRLSSPEQTVRSLLRWADFSYEPDDCPVCAGATG